jgi:hypothetical protein
LRMRGCASSVGATVLAAAAAIATADACSAKTEVSAPDASIPAIAADAVADVVAPLDGAIVDRDAGVDAEVGYSCGSSTAPVSRTCFPFSRCPACHPEAWTYACDATEEDRRPDIDGCAFVQRVEHLNAWCCPAACLARETSQGGCADAQVLYACPEDDGGLVVMPAGKSCSPVDAAVVPPPPGQLCCIP